MKNFYNFIRRRDLPSNCLQSLEYAVYGLGDSSYAKFNYVSKVIYRRLAECGARPIQELVLGDEQHRLGLDGAIYPRLGELYSALDPEFTQEPPETMADASYQMTNLTGDTSDLLIENSLSLMKREYLTKTGLALAKCTLNTRLTPIDHFQDTRLIQFDSISRLNYQPGDVCTILPANPDDSVQQFIEILNLDPNQKVAIRKRDPSYMVSYLYDFVPDGIKIHDLVKYYLDILSVPKRSFFEFLSIFSDDQLERDKLLDFASTDGQEDMYEYCIQPKRSILEVLLDFPHTVSNIKLQYLFDLVPPIKSRSFSIASSPRRDNNRIQLIVGVVRYRTRLRKVRKGLCSNYLAQLEVAGASDSAPMASEIRYFIQKSMFKLPSDKSIPVLMIGPGLGIAPFKSFIDERVEAGIATSSNTYLYFGCRYKNSDFYFREELEQYAREGYIQLRVAFSREGAKQYVQDLLVEDSDLVRNLILEREASVYIAGNSKLPESVRNTFSKVLVQDEGDIDASRQGDRLITQLENQGRILYDCW